MKTIIYKDIEIVKYDSDKIIINTGGWYTQQVKAAINMAASKHKLKFSVSREFGEWVIRFKGEKLSLLSNRTTLRR